MYRGEFEGAQKLYESALAIRRSSEQKIPVAESQLNLAVLDFEKGDSSSRLEDKVRELIGIFQLEKSTNDEVAATALWARILNAKGRPKEALAVAEKAISVAVKADPNFRLSAMVVAIPIRFANGRSTLSQAIANLEKTKSEARKFGYFATEIEAMLVVGELEMKSGAVGRGRTELELVRKQASRRGYVALAHKAALVGAPKEAEAQR